MIRLPYRWRERGNRGQSLIQMQDAHDAGDVGLPCAALQGDGRQGKNDTRLAIRPDFMPQQADSLPLRVHDNARHTAPPRCPQNYRR